MKTSFSTLLGAINEASVTKFETHSAAPRPPLFLFLLHFDLSVIYYSTDSWQQGMHLLISLQFY